MHSRLIEIITADVIAMFRLDSEQLFMLKLEYGEKYIDERYVHEPHVAQALKASPIFWNWWRGLWAVRDRQLMKRCQRCQWGLRFSYPTNSYKGQQASNATRIVMPSELHELYEDFHYWRKVQFYPNSVMIQQCLTWKAMHPDELLTLNQ